MLRAEDYEQGRYEEKKEITVQERNLWETVPAQDENYQSFIVRYNQNVEGTVQYESDRTFQIIDDMFGVTYVPASQVPEPLISSFSYFSVPKCYTYMDQGSLGASGVTRLHGFSGSGAIDQQFFLFFCTKMLYIYGSGKPWGFRRNKTS